MYAGLCQLNQQMILAAGPLDVNPIAVLILQPLFLLVSPVGGTAAVLPRTRTSQVSHSSPSATPLPHLPHLRVIPVWGLAGVHRPWCARHGVVNVVNKREPLEASHRSRTSEPSYSSPRGLPLPRRPLPRPRRRPPPWCSPCGVVNVVKERLPLEEYCTWRG